jgi:hypothetical protein
MSTFDFKPDEVIDITLKGVRVRDLAPRGEQWLAGEIGGFSITLPLCAAGLTAEHAIPDVRPGDLWRDRDGTVWFGIEGDDGHTYLMCSADHSLPVLDAVREWGPLTSVHREGRS